MTSGTRRTMLLQVVFVWLMSACAAQLETALSAPSVVLRDVQVVGLGYKNQTFLLSFSVSNPNPFALPVKAVSYAVYLDGERFASGETLSEISVPASGSAEYAISVDLDLLKTAPQLLSIVHQGVREDIGYELDGQLTVALPLVPPLSYRSSGTIRLQSDVF